jgi:hypothetical protein
MRDGIHGFARRISTLRHAREGGRPDKPIERNDVTAMTTPGPTWLGGRLRGRDGVEAFSRFRRRSACMPVRHHSELESEIMLLGKRIK